VKAIHQLALTPTRRATLKKYGLDEADFVALLELQGGACAICQRPFTPSRVPHVDHDHNDELTRGLLCAHDNFDLLGRFTDNVTFYGRVVAYLTDPPAAQLPGPPRRAPGAPPLTQ